MAQRSTHQAKEMRLTSLQIQLLIIVLGVIFFIPGLGTVHLFDWDEINFAEAAREMIATGNYSVVQINYQPFWEKPPLFFWMQVISMKLFGINEFAARFPNALCGIITLLILFRIGAKHFSEKFGLIWSLVYLGSLLPHFYFKSGIIDPWFNLFIFLGIYYMFRYSEEDKQINFAILSGAFIGLGILTKGPVALLVAMLVYGVYTLVTKFKNFIKPLHLLVFILSFSLVGGSWFLIEILNGRIEIVQQFIEYQIRLFQTEDAGHGGPFYYHFIVLLLGCFPASIFAIHAHFVKSNFWISQISLKIWMLILFWVVLILFSIVNTKIVHYSSMCYFPLTFLATYSIYYFIKTDTNIKKWISFSLLSILIVLGILTASFPFIDANKQAIIESGIIKDVFAQENLRAKVSWSYWYALPSLLFVILGSIILIYFRKNAQRFTLSLFMLSAIFLASTSMLIVPKIEPYSQGAAIEFYQSKANEDCYITTYGFKSYAHLFYAKKRPNYTTPHYDQNWLYNGDVDKPVYVVAKIQHLSEIENNYPQLDFMYKKNGFLFYKRAD